MLMVRSRVGDKIGSPIHPWSRQAHAAQGGVTLGLEQGEVEADFDYLGIFRNNVGKFSAC
jgi:hypothetical protein